MPKLYHATLDLAHDGVFTPRIPENRLPYEDDITPRICFATSLDGCLSSAPFGAVSLGDSLVENDRMLKIFEIDTDAFGFDVFDVIDSQTLYEQYGVDDAVITGEYWLLEDFTVPIEQQHVVVVTEFDNHSEPRVPFRKLNELINEGFDVSSDEKLVEAYYKNYDKHPVNHFMIDSVVIEPVNP